ncbi:DUF6708 domain-containing protein [Massilia sp. SR12]
MYSPEFLSLEGLKVKRPLQKENLGKVLKIREKSADFDENLPHYQLSVIRLNSSFVELTDRDYPIRGVATMVSLLTITGLSWFLASIISTTVNRWNESTDAERSGDLWFLGAAFLVWLAFFSFTGYAALRESFSYTHMPLRLNRKNRKIYVWRRDGTVQTASWDKVLFNIRCYKKTGIQMWDIVGHILSEDGQTIVDSFTLSSYTSSDAIDLQLHWEYFRRYMEEGPEQPHKMLRICLPLANRRETWWEGFMRLNLLMHGSVVMQLMMLPFNLPVSVGRLIAMRTSKIPQWPDWVEKECMIAKDDPYVRESGYEAPHEYAKVA